MRLFAGTPFDRPSTCERCGQSEAECDCQPPPAASSLARLSLEKRKRGKVVTVVRGLASDSLPALLSRLKTACGAGGTIRDGELEIQGDHVERIGKVLDNLGYRIRS